jgi:hypothetical protein
MAKDYAKIKALASSILECIGDDEEGMSPKLPKQKADINNGGQDEMEEILESDKADPMEGEELSEEEDSTDGREKKRKRDSAMAMMGSVLSSKFNKC